MFLQSGGAADRNRAADPDQLPGFRVEYFLVFELEDLLADLHGFLLPLGKKKQPSGCQLHGCQGMSIFR